MLFVIRHGQVITNLKNQVNGWNEEELTEAGINQAKDASNKIKKLKIDAVFCSPLLRTRQTYNNLDIKNIPTFYDDRLKERNSKSMIYADVKTVDTTIWYDSNKSLIYKDTEGFKSILDRTNSILTQIKNNYKSKNVLLVTHGDICKAIYLYFNPNTKDISKFDQDNCEIISYNFVD